MCITNGKTIALTSWIFVSEVMSLILNMFSRFVMGFPCGSAGKEFVCNAGDLDLIPGLEDPLEKGNTAHSSILA